MWDRRMIGVPNRPEKKTIEIDLPEGWIAASVAPRRQVDVGYPILIYVTVIEAAEAAEPTLPTPGAASTLPPRHRSAPLRGPPSPRR
jgi:hypothetical protein